MVSFLAVITQEWGGVIQGVFLVFMIIFFCVASDISECPPEFYENFERWTRKYGFILALMPGEGILENCFETISTILETDQNILILGWIVFCACFLYLGIYVKILYAFLNFEYSSLWNMKIFFITYPFFNMFISHGIIFLSKLIYNNMYIYRYYEKNEPWIFFFAYCLLSMPWVLYLVLSKNIKNIWSNIEYNKRVE